MKEVIMKVPSFSADYPKAPIYVADLVRCKECKHWHSGNCWGIPFSGDDASYIETESDDFCSYGEREGE